MNSISVKEFYKDVFGECCPMLESFLEDNNKDIGHFNVFNIKDIFKNCNGKPEMPYSRRRYYKISLINGKNRVEYAGKIVNINKYAVLFASPKIPYNYIPLDANQAGQFCIFTKEFLPDNIGPLNNVDDLPIFKPDSDFVFQITATQYKEISYIYDKMYNEIASDYVYKYDLLRNYLMELIHYGQKLKPLEPSENTINAATRISTLFIELLERQFPIESSSQTLQLKTAKDYANVLSVHVNHLNKVLKEATGKTTTEIIASRVTQEAKNLLTQTNWNVSEIAYSLGFDEVAHFSNFFKKGAAVSPLAFRN